MATDARLRISLSTGEFEVEGPETFISKYEEMTRQILTRLCDPNSAVFTPQTLAGPSSAEGTQASAAAVEGAWPEFGEAIHKLPRGATGTDQILLAGQYASTAHADQTFPTAEASKLLIEQGIKLANPSQSMKNNLAAKRVFKSGRGYKISREGTERINQLLGR